MNLEKLNVQELNTEDQKKIDGGAFDGWASMKEWIALRLEVLLWP
jgi:hypothetical protein